MQIHKYQHQTPPRPRVRKVIEQGISNEDKNAVAFIFSIIYLLRGTMSGHQVEIKRVSNLNRTEYRISTMHIPISRPC